MLGFFIAIFTWYGLWLSGHLNLIIWLKFLWPVAVCDTAEAWQTGIQDPSTPMLEGMLFFYNELMFYMVGIGIAVILMLGMILFLFEETRNAISMNFSHASLLEIIWTIIPAIILFFISVPSFTLLYSLDELSDPLVTLKITGHQWYWSYEYENYILPLYSESNSFGFDSYMQATEDLTMGSLRLLEVDHRVLLPINSHIRLLITSADVLHSWAIPSFGIKVDACPGRLTQASLFIKRTGLYFGQCSEICGVNHGFMPIVVKAVSAELYSSWLFEKALHSI
jgi:cytochrome c oxidase subunit 2